MTIPNMIINPTPADLPIIARRCLVVFCWSVRPHPPPCRCHPRALSFLPPIPLVCSSVCSPPLSPLVPLLCLLFSPALPRSLASCQPPAEPQVPDPSSPPGPCRFIFNLGIWTSAQHDGLNHLGLWHDAIPAHQMALITHPTVVAARTLQVHIQLPTGLARRHPGRQRPGMNTLPADSLLSAAGTQQADTRASSSDRAETADTANRRMHRRAAQQ